MRILRTIHGSKSRAQTAQPAAAVVAIFSLFIVVSSGWAQLAVRSRLNARNAKGLTPLIDAAFSGHADEVRSLLDQGASVDATAADGRTALIAATENNAEELADPDDRNGDYCAFYSNQLLRHSLIAVFDDVTIAPQQFPGFPESPNIHWRTSHVTSAYSKV